MAAASMSAVSPDSGTVAPTSAWARSSTATVSSEPRRAANRRGVSPASSQLTSGVAAPTSAWCANSTLTALSEPIRAASCRGVRPSEPTSLTSTLIGLRCSSSAVEAAAVTPLLAPHRRPPRRAMLSNRARSLSSASAWPLAAARCKHSLRAQFTRMWRRYTAKKRFSATQGPPRAINGCSWNPSSNMSKILHHPLWWPIGLSCKRGIHPKAELKSNAVTIANSKTRITRKARRTSLARSRTVFASCPNLCGESVKRVTLQTAAGSATSKAMPSIPPRHMMTARVITYSKQTVSGKKCNMCSGPSTTLTKTVSMQSVQSREANSDARAAECKRR
mmetsp:Transcript_86818/g.280512  ORF Transcript_86818/g.280512 Transcript_86818/m.280512 type:complete len:334 (-) Transcript_86818:1046-2047(-)